MLDKINNLCESKLKQNIKSKINKDINSFLKPTYFKTVPTEELFKILEKHGLVPVQEDGTYWSGMLLGGSKRTEQVNFNLATASSKNDKGIYEDEITNAMLVMTYYQVQPNGKYEIVAYIS